MKKAMRISTKKNIENSEELQRQEIDGLTGECSAPVNPDTNLCQPCYDKLKHALELSREYKLQDKVMEILHKLSRCSFILKDIKTSRKYIEELLELIRKGHAYPKEDRAYMLRARIQWLQNEYDNALTDYQKAYELSLSVKDIRQSAEICMHMSEINQTQGKTEKAVELLNRAIESFSEINDEAMLNKAKSNQATLFYFQGQFEEALAMKLSGINYFITNNDLIQLAFDYNTIAVIYYHTKRLEKAIEYSIKSLEIKEQLKDENKIAVTWGNLGIFYKEFGDIKTSLSYYEKALKFYQSTDNKKGIALNYNNIGNIHLEQKEYDLALDYFIKALQNQEEIGDILGMPTVLGNIGIIYNQHLKDYDKAIEYLDRAVKIASETKDSYSLLCNKLKISETLHLKGKSQEALTLLESIDTEIRNNNYDMLYSKMYQHYEAIFCSLGDYKQAHVYLKKYSEKMEEYYKSENSANIAEMQAKYETEQKEKEAELIRQKYLELEAKNKEIEEQKTKLQDTLDKLHNSEIRYNFVTEELTKSIKTTLVGKSKATTTITELIAMVARSENTNVLITGETGTGKEIVARNIHACSNRAKNHFYAVNCSAVPDTLFESQFFGHEKDAFTGANAPKIGWFEIADKSTLFLDEIGTLSANQQAKLLRVLEERQIVRVGSHREIPVNVRIISATNLNLIDKVNTAEFRRDLYHRLAIFVVNIPPLRERKEEIPLLLEHFVGLISTSLNKKISRIDKNIITHLQNYDYPGNVRELRNMVERAVLVTDSSTLHLENFLIPNEIISPCHENSILPLAEMEKQLLLKTLKQTGFNRVQTAKLLQVERKVIERKIKKYNITELDL